MYTIVSILIVTLLISTSTGSAWDFEQNPQRDNVGPVNLNFRDADLTLLIQNDDVNTEDLSPLTGDTIHINNPPKPHTRWIPVPQVQGSIVYYGRYEIEVAWLGPPSSGPPPTCEEIVVRAEVSLYKWDQAPQGGWMWFPRDWHREELIADEEDEIINKAGWLEVWDRDVQYADGDIYCCEWSIYSFWEDTESERHTIYYEIQWRYFEFWDPTAPPG